MTGLTDRTAQGLLGHITGKLAIFPIPTVFIGLFTAVGSDAGVGFTEVAGGAYARSPTTAATWNSAAGSGPSAISNANPITFAISTADWGTVTAFGLYDAVTAGNLLAWDYFGSYTWLPTQISAASPAILSVSRHGFLTGDSVVYSAEYGGSPPTFLQGNFTGLLAVTNPLTDSFSVTSTGSAVNTNTSGNGMVRKVASQHIGVGVQPTFPSGSLLITSA
jgi:hypothetical protein